MNQSALSPGPVNHLSQTRRICICFVLSYRAPDYIRGQSICAALRQSTDIELIRAVNRSRGLMRYWETLRGLIVARAGGKPDIYILGFRGHEMAWLVRWLTRGKPLLFDAMMSPYAALGEELTLGLAGRMLAPLWRVYEQAVLRWADVILVDTEKHARYYEAEFSIPLAKMVVIPVGAVEIGGPPAAVARDPKAPFRVLFYGSFLPLHGIDKVVEAAARLTDLSIEFRFIGGTPALSRWLKTACAAKGVRYSHTRWVPFEGLLHDEIPEADLCMGGPFGGTPQGLRVVTGKTSQCMALGKATIVGRIDEDYGFIDRVNCLLVQQADSDALAAAIRWGYNNRAKLGDIGQRGKSLYAERLSLRVISERLMPIIRHLAA